LRVTVGGHGSVRRREEVREVAASQRWRGEQDGFDLQAAVREQRGRGLPAGDGARTAGARPPDGGGTRAAGARPPGGGTGGGPCRIVVLWPMEVRTPDAMCLRGRAEPGRRAP
jgi:hypothetical protein